ncbi:HdeD family acid-resistance protein [Ferrimonas gelatinilytica]|uniref:DUF308 domain-containing protein n=1 Tax=Ferrimonas gelatinilytica TaxID=1255257 RepID=A0ABP9SE63_9GAMM
MALTLFSAGARLGRKAGFIFMALGVIAIAMPWLTGLALEWLLALILTFAGIAQLSVAFQYRHVSGFGMRALLGVVTLLGGLYLWLNPGVGLAITTLFLGLYFFLDGLGTLMLGRQTRDPSQGRLALLNGVITLGLALIILLQWPESSRYVVGILIGIKLLLVGIMLYVAGGVAAKAESQLNAMAEEQRFAEAKEVRDEDEGRN